MSTQSVTATGGTPTPLVSLTGLSSGLNTTEIISALIGVEREPVTHLSNEQTKLQAEQTQLRTAQSSLQQLPSPRPTCPRRHCLRPARRSPPATPTR
jgi:flagellar capping protein FliD